MILSGKRGGEKMNKNNFKCLVAAALILGGASACFAQESKNVDVLAEVPQQNGFTVSVSKIIGTAWTANQASIDFGTLVLDPALKIFLAQGGAYYAVDVGVSSNVAAWTITHTPVSIANELSPTDTLDNHINVSFVKQLTSTTSEVIQMVSFANSNKPFTKAQLSGGWLRIYYGLGTGEIKTDPSGNKIPQDAPGVTPVPPTQTFGKYRGKITLTLTSS
jgi:hypothetical protein